MKKTTLTMLLAGTLTYSVVSPISTVFACDSIEACESSLGAIQDEKEQAEADLAQAETDLGSTEERISQAVELVNSIQVEIDEYAELERVSAKKIESLTAEIEALEKEIVEKDQLLRDRMVIMQMQQKTNMFLDFLFNSKSLNDFISRSHSTQQITAYDKELMEEVRASKEQVSLLKTDAEAEQASANVLRLQSESKKAEQDEAIAQLQIERQKYAEQASKMRTRIDELDLDAQAATDQIAALEAYYAAQQEQGNSNDGVVSPSETGFYRPTTGPVTLEYMSIEYPYSVERPHLGVDYGAVTGTPVVAVTDGVVIMSSYGYNGGYGNMVVISHNVNGTPMVSIYGHLSSLAVSSGQIVSGGDYIGAVGNTGMSLGSHLHIEILSGISYMPSLREERMQYTVNPLNYF